MDRDRFDEDDENLNGKDENDYSKEKMARLIESIKEKIDRSAFLARIKAAVEAQCKPYPWAKYVVLNASGELYICENSPKLIDVDPPAPVEGDEFRDIDMSTLGRSHRLVWAPVVSMSFNPIEDKESDSKKLIINRDSLNKEEFIN